MDAREAKYLKYVRMLKCGSLAWLQACCYAIKQAEVIRRDLGEPLFWELVDEACETCAPRVPTLPTPPSTDPVPIEPVDVPQDGTPISNYCPMPQAEDYVNVSLDHGGQQQNGGVS